MGEVARSTRSVSVGVMKMQMVALFGLAVYFVYATTFASLLAGIWRVG